MPDAVLPVIPEYITVHIGRPSQSGENIQVPFQEYIKNVASSEIYPTWPESAIRANIYAQISYALNRIYTEYYRARGYNFDITNSTQYDQSFSPGRDIFQNISEIVDDIFNNYIVRQGTVEPLFAQFCDGRNVTCNGLSQWGSVALAQQGQIPYEILQYYYGDDINLVIDAPVQAIEASYPGFALRLGEVGNDVRTIQVQLNRIANNYPSIPKINDVNGVFDVQTESAVRRFQEVFNLTPDGIVGKSTWYKIKSIYNGVKRVSDLSSEGIPVEDVQLIFPLVLQRGDSGIEVGTLQYYLAVIGYFNSSLPVVAITSVFDEQTYNAVLTFQQAFGLPVDGIVGRDTWGQILTAYRDTIASLPPDYQGQAAAIFSGVTLSIGSTGESVRQLQTYLSRIGQSIPEIGQVSVDGTFGAQTQTAVENFQRRYNLPVTGIVGAFTWNRIANVYDDLIFGT